MDHRILIADDESELVELMELYLKKAGIEVAKAYNGLEAMEILEREKVDLVVLDIMMPKLDGFEVLKKIRERSYIPVIILSAKGSDLDKVMGLGLGADDYVTKPFSPLELSARVRAQLRRFYDFPSPNTEEKQAENILVIGDIELNIDCCRLTVEGQEIELTSKEFQILYFLLRNKGKVFTKKQIFEAVWEENYCYDDNTIMVHIRHLREKIEKNPSSPEYLKTVRGIGYRLEGR